MERRARSPFELVPTGPRTFRYVQREVDVKVTGEGTLEYAGSDVGKIRLVRVQPATPDASKLAEYAGMYRSPELEVQYRFVVDNGRLILQRRLMRDQPLQPTYADAFVGNGNWVFTRDAAGKVNGFLYSQGRVRRVLFEKVQ